MSLTEYFEHVEGIGILGTADAEGNVDLAIYARPHVIDENEVAFIMADRLSHTNINRNPHAAYLFVEKGGAYNGLRMYLTRTREETDAKAIDALRRKERKGADYGDAQKFLVYFKVEEVRRLVGD
jgi:hypothetical protein